MLSMNDEIFKLLFEFATEGIVVVNAEGEIEMINPSCEEMFGYEKSELLGKKIEVLVPDRLRSAHTGHREKYHGSPKNRSMGKGMHLCGVKKSNQEFPIEVSLSHTKSDNEILVIAFIIDITERKRKEEEAIQLGRIFEESQNEIYIFEADTLKFTRVNQGAIKNIGYTLDELKTLTPVDIKPEYSLEEFTLLIAPLKSGKVDKIKFETLHCRKDRSTYPVEVHLQLSIFDGHPMFMAIIIDISERRRAAEALRKEKETAQTYLDVANAIFIVLDKDEQVIRVNQKGCEVLQREEQDILGKNWFEHFVPESERMKVRKTFDSMAYEPADTIRHFESMIITPSKEFRLIEWHNTVIYDEEGKPSATISSGIDITERKKMESSLMNAVLQGQEQERKRVAKELHDGLGQSLSAINLNLNALEPELEIFNQKFRSTYNKLKLLLENTISDVKTISHNLMPRILENYGLVKALDYLFGFIDETNQIKINFQPYGLECRVDPKVEIALYRIVQELMNNILKHAQSKEVNVQLVKHEDSIVLLIEDDGRGFDIASVNQVSSDGFGLKNIATRVKALDGLLELDSTPGKGTSVTVELPIKN
ncbi:PAS domain S-box protein [Fulvivirgaceae bacterium BMA10]|uniref:Oxygen sensor histidine kinase NreB n=1 Tax=Splendidivirga corallicola TaxID=3051826 RepID=A0ABT8KY41_9BACT|nr:PAS domain S-box protein [Fulvivirgaceae bacterium BMA10]